MTIIPISHLLLQFKTSETMKGLQPFKLSWIDLFDFFPCIAQSGCCTRTRRKISDVVWSRPETSNRKSRRTSNKLKGNGFGIGLESGKKATKKIIHCQIIVRIGLILKRLDDKRIIFVDE